MYLPDYWLSYRGQAVRGRLMSLYPHESQPDSSSGLQLHQAHGFWARLRGLHAWNGLPWHTGLYIKPCSAIHTCGLAYTIDLVFLSAGGQILMQQHDIKPWRIASCRGAAAVVELPGGYCRMQPNVNQAIFNCLSGNSTQTHSCRPGKSCSTAQRPQ